MLVTPEWLAAHLGDPNLVVIGIGQRAEYDAGHIPGSRFLDYNSIVLSPAPERPNS
jgi:thiosulfate/3-mercaptopyruvate sulfurtransferase